MADNQLGSLLDLIDMSDAEYRPIKAEATARLRLPQIFAALDEARRIIRGRLAGHNVIRYLLVRLHNQVLKRQYNPSGCYRLSDLNLQFGCIPFDQMPFCTSLRGHNPPFWDLAKSLDVSNRRHELLARRVKNNIEHDGILYTPVADLESFGDVTALVADYNGRLYHTHTDRQLVLDQGHAFIRGYEDDTFTIVEHLQKLANSGIDGYTGAVERWLAETDRGIDDEFKQDALKQLFNASKVALIYGAAGTGKSTIVDHIAGYFNDKTKLFLAHTNPAVDNLKRKVSAQHTTFRTISSHVGKGDGVEYDLLVIDECSTVSNTDLLKVLERTSFKLLVLVGDVYQIESIQFGNWFSIIRSFIPASSVFELTTPFRTTNMALLDFWGKVRGLDDAIAEVIARNGYSSVLDASLFKPQGDDEIILCLNYDGLYGINNVNRFLQASNPNPPVSWGAATYKVGDPVLFNETERFRPVIYNNLKGRIADIVLAPGLIQFDVEVDRPLSEFDVLGTELDWVRDSTVRFNVVDRDTSDTDDDALNTGVPFQVAYAVSIHKAQGLEYNSVKIVITDANDEDLAHSIFYTAVTRARQDLRIFWTPETQQAVLSSLHRDDSIKDLSLLSSRRSLTPIDRSRRR